MRKRIAAVCVCCALVLVMSGCGRKKVEYNIEQEQTATETEAETDAGAVSGSLAEQIGAPKQWVAEYDGNGGTMTKIIVSADVKLPEVQKVKALKMKGIRATEDYKKAYLESLSEGIIYQFDEPMRPKAYWEAEIALCEGNIRLMEEAEADSEMLQNEYGNIAAFRELYDAAPSDYVPAENFQGNCYAIPYNGMDYQVEFFVDDAGYLGYVQLQVIDNRQLVEDSGGYQFAYLSGNGTYKAEGNQYVRTEEQIFQEVEAFLAGLGIDGFSAKNLYNLEFVTDNGNWNNGCELVLYRDIDGMYADVEEYEEMEVIGHNDEGEEWTMPVPRNMKETIYIYVNDKGVIGMIYNYPKEEVERIDDIQLLPFESIQDIAVEYARNLEGTQLFLNTMELCYCIFSESSGAYEFMLIPVWKFCKYEDSNRGNKYTDVILINAIDGTYIGSSGIY